jgi:hypothetical protein
MSWPSRCWRCRVRRGSLIDLSALVSLASTKIVRSVVRGAARGQLHEGRSGWREVRGAGSDERAACRDEGAARALETGRGCRCWEVSRNVSKRVGAESTGS